MKSWGGREDRGRVRLGGQKEKEEQVGMRHEREKDGEREAGGGRIRQGGRNQEEEEEEEIRKGK